MNKKIFYGCLILLSVGLFGCKTSKKTTSAGLTGIESTSEFISLIEENVVKYETLTARLNVEISMKDNNISSRAELKMVKDSALQISVQPFLGIEMFRIELTPDSVKMIDRMNKRYVADNYSNLKGQTPIEFNFYNLQALFTNQIFLPGQKNITKKHLNRFKLSQEENGSVIKVADAMNLMYIFAANANGKITSTTVNDAQDRYQVLWNYNDFRTTAGEMFPMKMDIQLQENEVYKGGARIEFSRIQLNQRITMEMNVPSKYKQITLNQILKSLSNIKM